MTTEERDRLGRVAYTAAWASRPDFHQTFDDQIEEVQEQYRDIGEAVRAAVLAGNPYVQALMQVALAAEAWEDAPLDIPVTELIDLRLVRTRALIALCAHPEWRQRQQQP